MSKYNRTKLLPYGLRFIQGVVRGNTKFEIKGASFGITQVTDNDVINAGKLPNIVGSIPIVAIDDDSLASQGVLGIELSFTQKSTGINHDVTLWDVQINGQQERDNQERPIAYTIAQQPETLTLSDPSFEFRLMVYVQVGDTDKVTINVNQDGMESRAEHARDFNRLARSIADGYIEVDLKDHNGNQVYDSDHKIVRVKRAVVNTDKSLSILNRAADAKKVGEVLNNLDKQLRALDSLLHTNYATLLDLNDVKNSIIANADANKDQDNQIAVLQNRASELEANTQTVNLLGHDRSVLSGSTHESFKATRQFIVNDATLTNPNGYANARATGDAINTAYQQLNHAIGLIMAVLDSLDKKQVIIDIKNRLSALEDQKKENK